MAVFVFVISVDERFDKLIQFAQQEIVTSNILRLVCF